MANSPVDVAIAIKPNDINAVPGLIKELYPYADQNKLDEGGETIRLELLSKARSLVQALQTPRETMIMDCWAQLNAIGALSFGVATQLWETMAQKGDETQRVEYLAIKLNIDPDLLVRIMRHLGAMGYVKEMGVDEYRLTNFTKAMSLPTIGSGYLALPSCTGAAPLRFHEYARKHGYKNPTDAKDTPMMYAYGTDMNMFDWQQSQGYGKHFNDHMGGYHLGRLPWHRFFPVKEYLVNGADDAPDTPFLVDIGGSVGHDLVDFKKHHPSHPGKLILQDLPKVIGQIDDLDQSIQRMGYDFLTEQPVKGARAYYMHSCLHDWPDDVCQKILARIKEAMKPGYSKLLINENVIPEKGVHWEMSALDMTMMTLFSAEERKEKDWYRLLEGLAGFKVVKIWYGNNGAESLIEVDRVQTPM